MGQTKIRSRAVSGGRGGSTTSDGVALLKNNPFSTKLKATEGKEGSVGGTLPLGIYSMEPYPVARTDRANWVRLVPDSRTPQHGRTDFALHGRGKVGSQGCIVPLDGSAKKIVAAVKAYGGRNGRAPTLAVVAIGDFDPLIGAMKERAATA